MKNLFKGMFSISAKDIGKEIALAGIAATFTFGIGYYLKKKYDQDKK
jgi:hypothetical protein